MSHQILKKIYKEVEDGNVDERPNGDYSLFKYSADCQFENRWNDINQKCRGIVFERQTGKIVARPFNKFFNLNERPSTDRKLIESKMTQMPWNATEKIDGSMISISYYNNSWQTATPGSITSPQAIYVKDFLLSKYQFDLVPKDLTYVFEFIAPHNQIVLNYGDKEKLILLAAFENKWELTEVSEQRLKTIAQFGDFEQVKKYEGQENILDYKIPQGQEGFVIRFEDGFRIKLKSFWYMQCHKMLEYINEKRILEILSNGSYNQLCDALPEHIRKSADDIWAIIQTKKGKIQKEIESYWNLLSDHSNFKKCAETWKDVPNNIRSLLFYRMRHRDENIEQKIYQIMIKESE